MRRALIVTAVLALLPALASADEVLLKGGGRISGRILSRTDYRGPGGCRRRHHHRADGQRPEHRGKALRPGRLRGTRGEAPRQRRPRLAGTGAVVAQPGARHPVASCLRARARSRPAERRGQPGARSSAGRRTLGDRAGGPPRAWPRGVRGSLADDPPSETPSSSSGTRASTSCCASMPSAARATRSCVRPKPRPGHRRRSMPPERWAGFRCGTEARTWSVATLRTATATPGRRTVVSRGATRPATSGRRWACTRRTRLGCGLHIQSARQARSRLGRPATSPSALRRRRRAAGRAAARHQVGSRPSSPPAAKPSSPPPSGPPARASGGSAPRR